MWRLSTYPSRGREDGLFWHTECRSKTGSLLRIIPFFDFSGKTGLFPCRPDIELIECTCVVFCWCGVSRRPPRRILLISKVYTFNTYVPYILFALLTSHTNVLSALRHPASIGLNCVCVRRTRCIAINCVFGLACVFFSYFTYYVRLPSSIIPSRALLLYLCTRRSM